LTCYEQQAAARIAHAAPADGRQSISYMEGKRRVRKFVPGFAALVAVATISFRASAGDQTPAPIDTGSPQVQQQAKKIAQEPPLPPPPAHRVVEDRSGRKQTGKASVYAPHFQGRKMADGGRFDGHGHAAASRSLPLGTVAKVTNIEKGKTAVVTVKDRGPYVSGRTMDVTPSTAAQLGIDKREGVAPVVVAPVAVPQPNGSVTPGAGALPGPATAK
jgi:rare lipoprotein A